MTAPTCKDCGSTAVRWEATKSGGWMLVDTKPRPHVASCPSRRRRGRNGRDEALDGLQALGYKAPEARKWLLGIPLGPADTMIAQALKRAGKED